MKENNERSKKSFHLPITIIAIAVVIILIVNLFIMTKVNSDQTEDM